MLLPCHKPPPLVTGGRNSRAVAGSLHNTGQEAGLPRIISQHSLSLSPFPGCFPGPFCYTVQALRACDHGDKTHRDAGAAERSRLAQTGGQAGIVLSPQHSSPANAERKMGFSRDRGLGARYSTYCR